MTQQQVMQAVSNVEELKDALMSVEPSLQHSDELSAQLDNLVEPYGQRYQEFIKRHRQTLSLPILCLNNSRRIQWR
ncbi:hypothetical protein Hamer_G012079 [Homarus americanus]|uniref:Uncharacterized protein n=1 Tax=Homarus americanus TaxID=6706 RepID=A0A8J5JHY1_HOMAM|nr:hypothetical protein Hamer_G012079 [Homarus americanus]